MLFFLVVVGIMLAITVHLHLKHKALLRRQSAYGDIKAYHLLQTPDDYQELEAHFKKLSKPDERYFYSLAMSRIMYPQTLEKWLDDSNRDGDALLCYGAHLLQWSWQARGYGRGAEISEDRWQEFFHRLEITRNILLECADKTPEDPTPWAYLVMIAAWHGDDDDTKWSYFNKAIKRDPNNWPAHIHMIIALSKKWGGCNEEMLQFARDASKKAPDGSDIGAILVKAFIEIYKYHDFIEDDPKAAQAFLDTPEIQAELVAAYDKSLNHKSHRKNKTTIFARYNLSCWFWFVRDRTRLTKELKTLGPSIEEIHWRWAFGEGELERAWEFIREKRIDDGSV